MTTTTESTVEALEDHPAKFSDPILETILRLLDRHVDLDPTDPDASVQALDPFAGVGRVHSLMDERSWLVTSGIELEPEWAACHERTQVGTALALPFDPDSFDALISSPCYGNRMSDQHEARDPCRGCDGSGCTVPDCLGGHPDDGQDHRLCGDCRGRGVTRRHTYRHTLARPLSKGSGAGLQWGPGYRRFHHAAWDEARRVLRPGALVLLNVSNHIRGGEEQLVVEWHLQEWLSVGARLVDVERVETRRQGHGANRDLRVGCEFVLVLRAPETGPLGL